MKFWERLLTMFITYPLSIGWVWLIAAVFNPDVDSGVIWMIALLQAGWSHYFFVKDYEAKL